METADPRLQARIEIRDTKTVLAPRGLKVKEREFQFVRTYGGFEVGTALQMFNKKEVILPFPMLANLFQKNPMVEEIRQIKDLLQDCPSTLTGTLVAYGQYRKAVGKEIDITYYRYRSHVDERVVRERRVLQNIPTTATLVNPDGTTEPINPQTTPGIVLALNMVKLDNQGNPAFDQNGDPTWQYDANYDSQWDGSTLSVRIGDNSDLFAYRINDIISPQIPQSDYKCKKASEGLPILGSVATFPPEIKYVHYSFNHPSKAPYVTIATFIISPEYYNDYGGLRITDIPEDYSKKHGLSLNDSNLPVSLIVEISDIKLGFSILSGIFTDGSKYWNTRSYNVLVTEKR